MERREKSFAQSGTWRLVRDHRKLVVIDGREAFVGGHCIVDSWLGDAQDSEHFADISVRLRGPIVHSVQSAFSEDWAGETGSYSSAMMCFRPWNLQATC